MGCVYCRSLISQARNNNLNSTLVKRCLILGKRPRMIKISCAPSDSSQPVPAATSCELFSLHLDRPTNAGRQPPLPQSLPSRVAAITASKDCACSRSIAAPPRFGLDSWSDLTTTPYSNRSIQLNSCGPTTRISLVRVTLTSYYLR